MDPQIQAWTFLTLILKDIRDSSYHHRRVKEGISMYFHSGEVWQQNADSCIYIYNYIICIYIYLIKHSKVESKAYLSK